ncbi:helix-turn-helix domain-containing protein [Paenibacillus rigui]|uniref:HTH araC/xylS-type domain-containing protein n=1 Tax=Paenibacillus rigui TaxID=554312 RepID=A0A229UW40_9BACL|nr:helix-turn-helix domain-containing protein [Paenibacillus rigui]OXM87634.1 hypothetical protein CF651_03945 [Paenibacillus rigui]
MPRTRKLQLLYKELLVPLSFGIVAMSLILWEQGSQGEGNRSVPWSEWILLIYGLVVTVIGLLIFRRKIRWGKTDLQRSPAFSTLKAVHTGDESSQRLQEQLNYLTDSQKKLEEQLKTQTNRLKQYMIHPLFHGGFETAEMMSQLGAMGYSFEHQQWYAVVSVQIEPLEQTRFEEKDRELLYFSVQNMLEELIPAANRLPSVRLEHTIVLLVMNDKGTKETLRAALEGWIATVQTAVYHYIQLKTCIGVSGVFGRIEDCPAAFHESVKAFKYHNWSGQEQSVFYFEAMQSGQGLPFPEAHPLEPEWLEAVKSGETMRADMLMKQIIQDLFQTSLHPLGMEMSMVRLLLLFLDHMRQWGTVYEPAPSLKTSLLQEVLELRNAAEAERWFKESLMEPCIRAIEGTMKSHKRHLLDQIVHIIHEEYDTELSLESVAGRLHYNPNYLSGLFNKEMNITFSEYLAKYRHDMARKWLIETELPVKEIACRLQYKNSQNFIRSFRKGQGMTPGEFRLKYGRNPLIQESVYLLERNKEHV